MDFNVLVMAVGGGLGAAFLILVVVVVRSMISSRPIRYCRGCGDPIPERSMTGRCWRCGLPYADMRLFREEREADEALPPDRPDDEGRFRKDANDFTGDR
jgi:hypothetical protein